MRSENCLYCGTSLVPDPQNRQWSHCPSCAPHWTDHIANLSALAEFQAQRQSILTRRGLPAPRPT